MRASGEPRVAWELCVKEESICMEMDHPWGEEQRRWGHDQNATAFGLPRSTISSSSIITCCRRNRRSYPTILKRRESGTGNVCSLPAAIR